MFVCFFFLLFFPSFPLLFINCSCICFLIFEIIWFFNLESLDHSSSSSSYLTVDFICCLRIWDIFTASVSTHWNSLYMILFAECCCEKNKTSHIVPISLDLTIGNGRVLGLFQPGWPFSTTPFLFSSYCLLPYVSFTCRQWYLLPPCINRMILNLYDYEADYSCIYFISLPDDWIICELAFSPLCFHCN